MSDPAESGPAPATGSPVTLAADFPGVTREQWRELVRGVLARSAPDGAAELDPEAALASETYDGLTIRPLYTAADAPAPLPDPGVAPFTRGAVVEHGGWDVRAEQADPDPRRANLNALADLAAGATSLWLRLGPGAIAVGDLPLALEGVYLDLAPIVLDAGAHTEAATEGLLASAGERGVPELDLAGSLGADPIGARARSGAPADLDLLGRLARRAQDYPNLRIATIDATVYHDAGCADSDELAVATSVGVAYLRALTEAGIDVGAALDALEFRFAVSADQFGSIAKLRAARRIWDRVAELSGAPAQRRGQRQHAVTSRAMLTRRDPWVNLLRATIAGFAAAVGGAEAVTVVPFDAAIGSSDDFARRIARNTQAILHDESSLGRVDDAAGGSWYVESRTEQLAERAWEQFTGLERAGGALAALEDGRLGTRLARSWAARRADIAHRRAPITGVSEFALITEEPVSRPATPPSETAGLLPVVRYAEDFEALRDRADAHLTAHGERPRVYLATLGPVGAHSGRAGFAANLFQAGGIEVLTGPAEDYDPASSAVACLCSSDRVYGESADSAARALKAAGVGQLWLAGSPGEREAADRAAGVDGFVFVGVDAVEVLGTTFETLGVS